MNSYKEAVQLGRKFIEETEATLLRIQVMQKNKQLRPVNALTLTGSGNNSQTTGPTATQLLLQERER